MESGQKGQRALSTRKTKTAPLRGLRSRLDLWFSRPVGLALAPSVSILSRWTRGEGPHLSLLNFAALVAGEQEYGAESWLLGRRRQALRSIAHAPDMEFLPLVFLGIRALEAKTWNRAERGFLRELGALWREGSGNFGDLGSESRNPEGGLKILGCARAEDRGVRCGGSILEA